MLICPKCHTELVNGTHTCSRCGSIIEQAEFCGNCGEKVVAGNLFCIRCGKAYHPSGQIPASPTGEPALYTAINNSSPQNSTATQPQQAPLNSQPQMSGYTVTSFENEPVVGSATPTVPAAPVMYQAVPGPNPSAAPAYAPSPTPQAVPLYTPAPPVVYPPPQQPLYQSPPYPNAPNPYGAVLEKKKFAWYKLIIALAIVFCLVIAGLTAWFVLTREKKEVNDLMYIKKGQLVISDIKKPAPANLTSQLQQNITNSFCEEIFTSYHIIGYSEDKRFLFYPDSMDEDYLCDVYRRNNRMDPESEGATELIDSDIYVTAFSYSPDGLQYLYIKGLDNKLYFSRGDRKVQLGSKVDNYSYNEDCSYVTFCTTDGELYEFDAALGSAPLLIDTGIDTESIYNDWENLYYLKEGYLYYKVRGLEPICVDSGVNTLVSCFDDGSCYYTKINQVTYNWSDYVVDDMISDRNLKEPKIQYYSSWEAYDDAYRNYIAKLERDDLRSEIEEGYTTFDQEFLYFFDGANETLVSDKFSDYYDSSNDIPVLLYTNYKIDKAGTVNLSQLESSDEVHQLIKDSINICWDYVVAVGSQEMTFGQTESNFGTLTPKGDWLYYMDKVDSESIIGSLCRIRITDGSLSKPEQFNTDVYKFFVMYYSDDSVAYFKNVVQKTESGDLYLNDRLIAKNVYMNSIYRTEEGTMYYLTEYDMETKSGRLMMFKDGSETEIASNAAQYVYLDQDHLMYLTDYHVHVEKGTAMLYSGGKSTKLDSEVSMLVWDYGSVVNSYYYLWSHESEESGE